MDQHKIDNYYLERPAGRFPEVTAVDATEVEALRRKICQRVGLPPLSNGLDLVREVDSLGTVVAAFDANQEDFSLRKLTSHLGCTPNTTVFLNWYRFDELDEITFSDLADNFSYIWYPSADDLDVFDRSLDWIISIAHHGAVSVVRASS